MPTVLALLRCSHPGPTVAVTMFASALALGAGSGAGVLRVGAAVLAGQLSVGWLNDCLDAGRDRVAGRVDKPIVAGEVEAATVGRAAVVALAACVALSLLSGPPAAAAHLLAVAAAWAYNLGLKATALSVVPYALAFGLLPAFVTLAPPLRAAPPAWAVAAGALLGASAHFTNVLSDLDTDAATGVRGLPHRLGRQRSTLVAALLSAGAGLAVAAGARPLPPLAMGALLVAGLLVGAVAVTGVAGRGRVAFRLTMATAGALVVAFVSAGLRP
jgi:4-hydroxybenzoate polyprenyltransferase